jgi:hypothetical protein
MACFQRSPIDCRNERGASRRLRDVSLQPQSSQKPSAGSGERPRVGSALAPPASARLRPPPPASARLRPLSARLRPPPPASAHGVASAATAPIDALPSMHQGAAHHPCIRLIMPPHQLSDQLSNQLSDQPSFHAAGCRPHQLLLSATAMLQGNKAATVCRRQRPSAPPRCRPSRAGAATPGPAMGASCSCAPHRRRLQQVGAPQPWAAPGRAELGGLPAPQAPAERRCRRRADGAWAATGVCAATCARRTPAPLHPYCRPSRRRQSKRWQWRRPQQRQLGPRQGNCRQLPAMTLVLVSSWDNKRG